MDFTLPKFSLLLLLGINLLDILRKGHCSDIMLSKESLIFLDVNVFLGAWLREKALNNLFLALVMILFLSSYGFDF